MKQRRDLVRAWLSKADSDLKAAELALQAETALDTACFHAQQAAEKYLKAYLTFHAIEFPLTHNLNALINLCASRDGAFGTLHGLGSILTPYAVELRYDTEFWPALGTALEAYAAAREVRSFVRKRLGGGEFEE